jgi:hypothetical protein
MDFVSVTEAIIVPVMVASITAAGSAIAMFISSRKQSGRLRDASEKFREENTYQHNENKAVLDESKIILQHLSGQIGAMDHKVDRLDERLDNVQIWQVEHEKNHLNEQSKDNIQK